MIPEMSERSTKLRARVQEFMDEHIMPNESLYYQQIEDCLLYTSPSPRD